MLPIGLHIPGKVPIWTHCSQSTEHHHIQQRSCGPDRLPQQLRFYLWRTLGSAGQLYNTVLPARSGSSKDCHPGSDLVYAAASRTCCIFAASQLLLACCCRAVLAASLFDALASLAGLQGLVRSDFASIGPPVAEGWHDPRVQWVLLELSEDLKMLHLRSYADCLLCPASHHKLPGLA